MNLTANPNTHWAAIFVAELARAGLEAVCLAPGSRSTPLALAFAATPAIRLYRHLDERSAGFFALGLALASGRPVALVCTSGTAAANFHPAIVEAYYSHVPLLVLTADRPPELRQSGANQTIDQIKMFGDHVRWSVEVPTPQAGAPEVVLRHMRTLAARAYATAAGLVAGPVHLNFPFRKPLEPGEETANGDYQSATAELTLQRPFTQISRGHLAPDPDQIAAFVAAIDESPRGVIICGPGCPGGSFPADVVALAHRCGYPILADPLSGLRHGLAVAHGPLAAGGPVLGGYNLWLPAGAPTLRPDLILRFGAVPTSAPLVAFLAGAAPTFHIHIREDGEWADDQHLTTHLIQADPAAVCRQAAAELTDQAERESDWLVTFMAAEESAWQFSEAALATSPFFDGTAVHDVLETLPDGAILFAGNSMPVRHVDTFDRPTARRVSVYGNRGASGIDGNVSTALGLAAATGRPVAALLGDITFYHDMNGLLAVRQHGLINVTFVVINNDGGGIFHRLPIARHDPPFTELFLTPHGLTFEHAAAMYGLAYRVVADRAGLRAALAEAWDGTARLIEVKTDSAADYHHMRALAAVVNQELQSKRLAVTR